MAIVPQKTRLRNKNRVNTMTQVHVTKLNVLQKKLYIYVCVGGAALCIFVYTWRPEGGVGRFLLSGSIFSFEAGSPLDLGLCFPS